MRVEARQGGGIVRLRANDPKPLVDFPFNGTPVDVADLNEFEDQRVSIVKSRGGISITKELALGEHILGLGEKAFQIERQRTKLQMWNTDAYGYTWYSDPLYVSVPFFISVRRGVATGFFVNSTSRIAFDLGVEEYDRIRITVPEKGVELFVIDGPRIEEVIERYAATTGYPFMPPRWALGHHVSRWSYFPQSRVLEIVKRYKEAFPISAVFLDIGYMDRHRVFTWDGERFPDPRSMIRALHDQDIKIVTIIHPGISAARDCRQFREGKGTFCSTRGGATYYEKLWPGKCAFPDFVNESARRVWKKWVKEWVEQGVDGLWLDMNEPAAFNEEETFSESVVHRSGGKAVPHSLAHNAYAYFEAKATYEAASMVQEEPFMLSRSGFAGIQKWAATWTGDNSSSWEDLRLQVPMILGLGLSGVPFCGPDLGGFVGRTDPELLARYYQAAIFFPLLWNHKANDGSEQELFLLPKRFRDIIRKALDLRLEFEPYLYSLAYQAHVSGHPIARPLAYEFQGDEDAYHVNDEYMVGRSLLYAPQLCKGERKRDVYLPDGKWYDWWTEEERPGREWTSTDLDLPLYLRQGSVVPMSEKILVYGDAEFLYYDGKEALLRSSKNTLQSSRALSFPVDFIGDPALEAAVDGRPSEVTSRGKHTVVGGPFRTITLASRAKE